MDQFSRDLTVALEETSLLEQVRVNRWNQRRRTRSTGNLPCAPQPTEDSSSPTDTLQMVPNNNSDLLDTQNLVLPSDSDEVQYLPCKSMNISQRHGTLESDSLNETTAYSPARFFKNNPRRKRKLKRMSVECCGLGTSQNECFDATLPHGSCTTGTIRKRIFKTDATCSNVFCGKRKRSNRYEEHPSGLPRNYLDHRMRPRSYSSTSKPSSDRLLPLNRGLVLKIEKISQSQQNCISAPDPMCKLPSPRAVNLGPEVVSMAPQQEQQLQQQSQEPPATSNSRRAKKSRIHHRARLQQLQFAVHHKTSMDCGELNSFLSSSSLSSSSSDSDDGRAAHGTDREGDDELTDWPGNEFGNPTNSSKHDNKRKLTKKGNLTKIKSDEPICEDDTLMSVCKEDQLVLGAQLIEANTMAMDKDFTMICNPENAKDDLDISIDQIESEMSYEPSNPFFQSLSFSTPEVREIRAGCRRIKDERPGFTIKTSVNEQLSRFIQDPHQKQICLPDIEICEHESLISLATLYSLKITLENGSAILHKTSKTTQSVNVDQHSLQSRLLFSDLKRRCYES